jgi:hypothetical protein
MAKRGALTRNQIGRRLDQRLRQPGQETTAPSSVGVYYHETNDRRGAAASVTLKKSTFNTVKNKVVMTKRSVLISFFLASFRSIGRNFMAFLRAFTEEDVCALLSAYGLYGLEVARLQEDRSNEQKRTSGNFSDFRLRNSIDGFPGLISVGAHPDIFRTKRTKGSRNQARQWSAG